MRIPRWQANMMGALAVVALALYAVRWLAFPASELHNEMLRFLVGDIAFLFLQILLVTMVIDGVIQSRRQEELRQNLNMIIGAFFSQTGTDLLGRLARSDAAMADVVADLVPKPSWAASDYARARERFSRHEPRIKPTPELLGELRDALSSQRVYLLGLISNQSLLEHGTFTDLLWALTHVSEELDARADLSGLPQTDLAHLSVDLRRAFGALGAEWLRYLEHLQNSYPHLFSLAVRTNPLDPSARAVIENQDRVQPKGQPVR